MKILMLTPYLPYPLLSGGQIRTYNLLKKLANNHQVTLFALIKDESERIYLDELKKYCVDIQVFKRSSRPFTMRNIFKTAFSSFPFLVIRNLTPQTKKAVNDELRKHQYDLIHAETFYMMPNIPKTSIPILLVEQTIEYLGYESFAQKVRLPGLKSLLRVDIAKIRRWEEYYWRSCTKLITMSQEDKDFISRTIHDPEKIEVVSNGVDIQWFSEKKRALPERPTLLSVGTFNWLPNVEAVHFLAQKVWPLIKQKIPGVKLWIVGNAPTQEIYAYQKQDRQIRVSGRVKDIRDAFNKAHILLAPVLSGKGTRYKILEAMASQTPIIASPTAVEGLGVRSGKHVLIAQSAEEMAKMAIKLLGNQKLQKSLATEGKKFVTEHYDWSHISKKLDRIYRELGKKSHG